MDAIRQARVARGARLFIDSLTVLAFLVVIAAPTIDLYVRPDDRVRSPEKPELRTPAPKPAAPKTAQEVMAYPGKYEAYFKDSFGLRDQLLRWNSIVKVFGFGVSPSAEVFFGREGWLFYNGELSRENHRGAFPFKPGDLERWGRMLERKRLLLESLGVRYLYVVAPDKESVYSELLPGYMRRIGPTRLDQFVQFMKENVPRLEILDLRVALIDAKKGDTKDAWIYTNLGTHWTGRGSQVALKALLVRMNSIVPGFFPEEVDDFRRVEFGGNGDSWATRMYIGDLLPMPIHGYSPKSTHSDIRFEGKFRVGRVRKSEILDSSRPRVILMHDSFGPHIEQGLAEQCSYLECRWEHSLDTSDVEGAQPDILVDMLVERTLNHLDPIKLMPTQEHPWPGRFGKSKTTLVGLDTTLENWGLEAMGGTQLTAAAFNARRPRIQVVVKEPRDQIRLPALTPVPNEVPVLHVCIDSPFTTELMLYYRPEGQRDFIRHNAYRHPLTPGPNEFYMPLDKPGTSGELVLRPGVLPGTYLLRDLEIRSVLPPP